MQNLASRTAIITGASRGIGVQIAYALAGRQMNVVLAARSVPNLEAVAAELRRSGAAVLAIPTDVSVQADREALIAAALQTFGTIDVLVNNAAQITVAAYDRLTLDQIEQIVQVNLTAPLLLSRMVLPQMLAQHRGHIVNIASMAGKLGVACLEPYAATKAGLISFVETVRASYRRSGVSASAICPALVADAGMWQRVQHETGVSTPVLLGAVPPTRVAEAVVRAINHDLPIIYATPRPTRPLLALHSLFPLLIERLAPLIGGDIYQRATMIYERHHNEHEA
jgi:short-subunit dehydrogenase